MSDARTRQYTGGIVPNTPVAIDINEAIHRRGGRLALLAAANATARNHPKVFVHAVDVPHDTGNSMHELLSEIASSTESSLLEIVDHLPKHVPTIGIGDDIEGATVYVGADRFTGTIAETPAAITADPSSAWGASLAAMRAANHVFRLDIGLEPPSLESLSLWSLSPAAGSTGPFDPGPIDVGSAWLIGAGGVGSSLAWWLHHIGVTGDWTVVDHQRVDSTNLNRSLGMFVRHLVGADGGPAYKSDIAAGLIPGARSVPDTWNGWVATDPPPPDVLIPAANDFGVRGAFSTYSHPLAITGATSPHWTAELHLYRAGIDGCIDCRHPHVEQPSFACATVEVADDDGGSADASLSFLSGTAALMCAAQAARLQVGELHGNINHWQLACHPTRRTVALNTHRCQGGGAHALALDTRRAYFGGTRWFETERAS